MNNNIAQTEIGSQLLMVEKAPVDAKMVVDTLAQAQSYAFEGYNPYIRELKGFYFFVVGETPEQLLPKPGITAEAVNQMISNLINGAPGALDSLKELADAVNNDPNFAAGMIANMNTVNTQITKILQVIAVAPTYTAPTASLTNVTQTVERGSTLNLTLNIGFTKNDAGVATGYSLLRNAVEIATNQNNSQAEANIQSIITFQGRVSYGEGGIKLNNLGIEDPTGHIMPGTANSAIQTITPRLKTFYGSVAALPTTSAEARALSSVYENVTTIDLATGTANKIFVVLMPAAQSLVSAIDTTNLGANVTSEYKLLNSAFVVNDAGGNAQTYKLYAMQQAIANSTTAIHRITKS